MRSHLADVLMRQDKMMMGHGVENRVPFLDRHVIEFARALPAEHLVRPASSNVPPRTKIVVKELARRRFGAAFIDRRKSAFNLPLGVRPSNAERTPSRRAPRAIVRRIAGVFAGEAGLRGACSRFSARS